MLLGLGLLSKTRNGVNSVKRITYIVRIDFSMFEVQIFKCNSHYRYDFTQFTSNELQTDKLQGKYRNKGFVVNFKSYKISLCSQKRFAVHD